VPRHESIAGRDADHAQAPLLAGPHSPARPGGAPAALLALQRSAGNAAVVAILQASRSGDPVGRSAAAVGAQADTSGEHVVLGPGADDRHTLAHEPTHVVQQRRGLVAGADRGDRPTPHGPGGPASGDLTVQRKVGIEIETGWYVAKADKPLIGKTKPGTPLKKYDVVGEPFDGFKVTADTAPNKRSEIEFVVDPPVEEGDDGKQRLETVMGKLTGIGERMVQAGKEKQHFTQDKATDRKPDKNFVITPNGPLDGSPQVTIGLALDAITRMGQTPPPAPVAAQQPTTAAGQQPAPQPPPDRPAPVAMQPGAAYLSAQARRVTGKGALPAPSDDLRGLIAVISSYIIKGSITSRQLAYPKQIANVLMARTDFAKLFGLLPAAERTILEADRKLWVDLVVDAASVGKLSGGTIDPNANIIAVGTKRSGVRDLTITDWLTAIADNDDKLNSVYAPTRMGALKDRTEQVGPDNARREAGIFEFRASQMTKLPLARWKDFAIMAHAYITRLHGG
jgi:hypothetical protein